MAARVARAVPQVIDCDRVALFLDDGDWTGGDGGELRLAAAHGYPDAAVAFLSARPITEAQLRTMREEGCPPPMFQTNPQNVVCVLPAHPKVRGRRELFVR